MKVAVIGSGLASFGCCRVLCKNNFIPDIFDIGEDLDLKQKNFKDIIKNYIKKKKTEKLASFLDNLLKQNLFEFPKKKYFGSELLYNYFNRNINDNNPVYSNVYGGLANVWSGSALLPDKKDLIDWPEFTIPDLEIYKKYFSDLPYSSREDNINAIFPQLSENVGNLKYNYSIEKLEEKISKINTKNFISGFSKSFLNTEGPNGCKYCGLCMTGCVYQSIFNPKVYFEKLLKKKKINYFKNFNLIKIIKINNKIELIFSNGKKIQYDKVFLAAGALGSAKIILNSFQNIKETKLFYAPGLVIPLLSLKSYNFEWPNSNTLSKMFLEIKTRIINNWVHCQINQPSELVMYKLGFFKVKNDWIKKMYFKFFKRLFTITINYHSKYGGYYKLNLNNDSEGGVSNLNIAHFKNKNKKLFDFDIFDTILKKLKKLGFYSNKFFINHEMNCDHYYIGGTFPIKSKQTELTHLNRFGELRNIKNLHIVDSSTFPSIPGTTFGLLCMLNSARITESAIKN